MSDSERAPSSGGSPPGGKPSRPRSSDAAADAAVEALRARLATVLQRLPAVERQVVEHRMGLVDGVPAKPTQVAERLGLSRAEVRAIEQRAFARIREVGSLKGLERFLGR